MRFEMHAKEVEMGLGVGQLGGGAGGVARAAGLFDGCGRLGQQLRAHIRGRSFDGMSGAIGVFQRAVFNAI